MPIKNILGQVFGRLTVISLAKKPEKYKEHKEAFWNCQCFCGNTTITKGSWLTNNKTKSCGCLQKEAIPLKPFNNPKYPSDIAAAHYKWYPYQETLLFDDYYRIAKMSCFYCGIAPSMIKTARRVAENDKPFIFNTLDRIDSSKTYLVDNIVASCQMCNQAKLTQSTEMFYSHINDLIAHLNRMKPETYRINCINNIPSTKLHPAKITSMKAIYNFYQDNNLTIDQMYPLIISDCYYCGTKPSNEKDAYKYHKRACAENKNNAIFIYNGLDRIDNNLGHCYDNVVPCCKYCNSAKGTKTLDEFDSWIRRLEAYRPFRTSL